MDRGWAIAQFWLTKGGSSEGRVQAGVQPWFARELHERVEAFA